MRRQRRYLITGGAGFIGSWLVRKLIKADNEIIILDHSPEKSPYYDNPDVMIADIDVRMLNTLNELVKDTDIVIHLAGHTDVRESIKDPEEDADNNIMGAISILEACRRHNKVAVFASSAAVYGQSATLPLRESSPCNPSSPYGMSKLTAENYFMLYNKLYGTKTISLRLLNVAGPLKRKGVMYNFTSSVLNDKPITVFGDGEQTRDFIHVMDVVDAILKASHSRNYGEIFNIGSGKQISVNELLKMIRESSLKSPSVHYADKIPGEIYHSQADISKARSLLDWSPKRSLKDAVELTVEWTKNKATNQAWLDLNVNWD